MCGQRLRLFAKKGWRTQRFRNVTIASDGNGLKPNAWPVRPLDFARRSSVEVLFIWKPANLIELLERLFSLFQMRLKY